MRQWGHPMIDMMVGAGKAESIPAMLPLLWFAIVSPLKQDRSYTFEQFP